MLFPAKKIYISTALTFLVYSFSKKIPELLVEN